MRPFRLLTLAAPFVLAASVSAQTVLLRFKPPVGRTVAYTTTMTMTQALPGMPTPMSFAMTMPMTMRAVSRNAVGTTMETKMGQTRVTLPPGSPMAAMKAQMEKSSSGVTSTTLIDEFGHPKGASMGGGASAAMKSMGTGMMAGAQGVSYPKGTLKVGDTWSATLDMGKMMGGIAGGGMKATGTIPIVYRLVALKGGVATIGMTMKGATTMNVGSMGMKMSMNSVGSMMVEAATGLMKSMSMTSDTGMTMGSAGQKMNQHMVMTMKAG